ncbi:MULTISPECIES: GNAT family N-acetyltransferase [Bacillaceae]|uniref:GNAT family N-acetyltransferase n=1 Tax=Bacillaceae TaxID=186817 RepID=UPI001E30361C|nr:MULTISPECIES: GNAT family N-acetyltransferase [Bacillaceae]MCE4051145.1 GNAT family N-acetyltransferase [Bacillus sp. Au-Bac7]MCM3030252.1 GNAT family N-acetyltransferase [Niallia sp. MER 6]
MDIEIKTFTERKIKPIDVLSLYNETGWLQGRLDLDMEEILHKVPSVGAWKGDTLIGYARAVSDGHYKAYIEDVVIHRLYMKKSIGIKLVSKLLDELSCNQFILRKRLTAFL